MFHYLNVCLLSFLPGYKFFLRTIYINSKCKHCTLIVEGMILLSIRLLFYISGVVILTFFANKNRLNKLSAVDQFIMVLTDFSCSARITCFLRKLRCLVPLLTMNVKCYISLERLVHCVISAGQYQGPAMRVDKVSAPSSCRRRSTLHKRMPSTNLLSYCFSSFFCLLLLYVGCVFYSK